MRGVFNRSLRFLLLLLTSLSVGGKVKNHSWIALPEILNSTLVFLLGIVDGLTVASMIKTGNTFVD